MKLVQVNRQPRFGGGEVFTAILCRALSQLGVATSLLAHPRASYWPQLGLPADTEVISAAEGKPLASHLSADPTWLISHGPLPQELRAAAAGRLRTAIAHMPVQGRNPRAFDDHDMIYPVSGWVRDGLLAAGLPAWREPLYGVADLMTRDTPGEIRRTSRYDWDQRKGRDRLLGLAEPLIEAVRSHPVFKRTGERDPQLTLGVVSRLTPIKQFPLLFQHLAAVLARHPAVRLEVFGSGSYASVRDLDRALRPCRQQVRFWGQQRNVATIYRQIDYLLAGLPEKEALGLNIIEAQACGTPVIAVNAPPFTETVIDGETGFFYRDPRKDAGADFDRLLTAIESRREPLRPHLVTEHLARFSFEAFVNRLRPVVTEAQTQLSAR